MHWRDEKCIYVCGTGTLGLKIVTRFMCDEIQDKRSPHKTRAHVSLDWPSRKLYGTWAQKIKASRRSCICLPFRWNACQQGGRNCFPLGCDAVQLGRSVSELTRSLHISPEYWHGITSKQEAVYIVTVVRIYSTTVRESRRETKYTNTHAQKATWELGKEIHTIFPREFQFPCICKE